MKKLSPELSSMINFVKTEGISVNTYTKARGHQGFFMSDRIDISAVLSDEKKKEVLVHEYAHHIHYKLEPNVLRKHGSFEVLFKTTNTKIIERELIDVTDFVDKSSSISKLEKQKNDVTSEIKVYDKKIKEVYPDFKRSYPFKPLDSKLKKTEAKYLMNYDKVKIKTPFLGKIKVYTLDTFLDDFPEYDKVFLIYLRLKSKQRMLKRISSRLNRLNNYYKRPSELFARFVQGLYIDENFVFNNAPVTCELFFNLLEEGYYGRLNEFIEQFFHKQEVLCE